VVFPGGLDPEGIGSFRGEEQGDEEVMLKFKNALLGATSGLLALGLMVGCGSEEPEPEPEPQPISQNDPAPRTKTPEEHSGEALVAMYNALASGDYAAFRSCLWPAQVDALGEEAVDQWFASGTSWVAEVDNLEVTEVVAGTDNPYTEISDPDLEQIRRVRFVASNGGGDAPSSMQVVEVGGQFYVEWVEWEVPADDGGFDDGF
jgi:hypothetical protein